jgi:hypothetical protein
MSLGVSLSALAACSLCSHERHKIDEQLSGEITGYSVNPIAIQNGDNAAKNRLTVSVQFTILTTLPKNEEQKLSITRFADFDASTNFSAVESQLLATINEQVIQDVINKLQSNW